MKNTNLLHRVVTQPTLYDKQQNMVQEKIADRRKITWDLTEAQSGLLIASKSVGNVRTIINATLKDAILGGSYRLEYWQDEVGGRLLDFDSKFKVQGYVDLAPNSLTIVDLHVTKNYAKVELKRGSQTYLETSENLKGFKRLSNEEFQALRDAGEDRDEIVYIVE